MDVLNHPEKKKQIELYGDPANINELGDMLRTIISYNLENTHANSKLIGLEFSLVYSEKVSNTHSCPLGGVSNWGGRDKDAPNGYPGFIGQVRVRLTRETDVFGFGNHLFMHTLTHTGSGGNGHGTDEWRRFDRIWSKAPAHIKKTIPKSNILGFEYRVYLSDFPKLEKFVQHQNTIDIIRTGKRQKIDYCWDWNDYEREKAEEDFYVLDKKNSQRRNLRTGVCVSTG